MRQDAFGEYFSSMWPVTKKLGKRGTGPNKEAEIHISFCQGSTDLSSMGSLLWEVLRKQKLDERYMEEEKEKFLLPL